MKIFHIAWKDLTLAYRRLFLVGMAFVAPLLMAFIFSSAFGGAGEFEIERIDLGIVNLDVPAFGFSAGELVSDTLTGKDLADLLDPVIFESEESAIAAIEAGQVAAAVIIPPDLSTVVTGEGAPTQLRLIHDPAQNLAPQILESILDQLANGFSGARITADLAIYELGQRGLPPDPALLQQAVDTYAALGDANSESGNAYRVSQPQSVPTEQKSLKEQIVGGVMASMMVFFTYFTGAYGAETILSEEQDGTLARAISSPTRLAVILGGKSLGVVFILLLQMIVLLAASYLIFGIDWGSPFSLTIAVTASTVGAAGLGIFLMSLVKDPRQTGIVFGGVLTVMGMAGGLFTGGLENPPAFLEKVQAITPQGWSSRVWTLAQENAPFTELLADAGILFLIGLALFTIGVLLFQRRFAK